ncbi:PDDEXK nuclease domain-containing protein [Pseudoalteromonas aliena]|nr:PDDEXK nuclease domain-containing protein [Pseudoalteromonas aliena]
MTNPPKSNSASVLTDPALLTNIKAVIAQARSHVKQVVNSTMVHAYWQIGRLIVDDEQQGSTRAEYGKSVLKGLSAQLTADLGKGFDVSNLRNMRRFYLAFEKQETLSLELSWSHYNVLARIENPAARLWYMQEASQQNWSVRALERQIGTLYYERLLSSKNKQPVEQEAQQNDLEQGIINNLQQFLLELGKGFAFVERQKRIRFDDEDFYIDLVFYNFKLKCFLLLDLKIGKLKHQDIGQMDTYIRLYDDLHTSSDDNPTIGLVLCSEKSEAVVKYSVLSDQKQLFAAKYLAHLPSEEELRIELQKERARVQAQLLNQQVKGQDDE